MPTINGESDRIPHLWEVLPLVDEPRLVARKKERRLRLNGKEVVLLFVRVLQEDGASRLVKCRLGLAAPLCPMYDDCT